ncbi:PH domain-containing protein [Nitrincola sp. A-D6]|uniref:PH domain-containing protein n=1 Tax=Nitrincola sp. A-D6 TaxID=1545442 RepID=UPI00068F2699|nr:PH domain-containing protein [Nitrincola sp. A-D6]
MLTNEKLVLKIGRNPLYLIRGSIDLLVALWLFTLYRSATSMIPFWDDWTLVELYRSMMNELFDQVFAVPAQWTGYLLLLIGLYFLFHGVRRYVLQLSTRYTLTNVRIMSKSGVLGVSTHELMLRSVDGVSLQQSLLGRLLGYGTLKVAGRGGHELVMHSVSEVLEVKETLEKRLLNQSSQIPTLENSVDS